MHNYLLIMERMFRPRQAKANFERLKYQHNEKHLKGKLATQVNVEKSSKEHIDNMFSHELYVNEDC